MGYYTEYNLVVKDRETGSTIDPVNIIKELERRYEICGIFKADGSWDNHSKWYDYKEDMCEFSRLYPDYLFELTGLGEDSADIWKAWFLNGKMQKERATVFHGTFNIEKLKYSDNL